MSVINKRAETPPPNCSCAQQISVNINQSGVEHRSILATQSPDFRDLEWCTVMSDSPTKRAIMELKKQEGNDVCVDCGKSGKYFTAVL